MTTDDVADDVLASESDAGEMERARVLAASPAGPACLRDKLWLMAFAIPLSALVGAAVPIAAAEIAARWPW